MATSYINSMLLALLVTLAVVAPSMAARDAPAPSASDEVLHPMGLIDGLRHLIDEIGDLPLPRILPCPPDFPKIPLIPCYNVTKPVTECRPSLAKYMPPCAGYLTEDSSSAPSSPPKKCCENVTAILKSTAPLCLCHIMNGDASKLYQAPVNHTRAVSMIQLCGYDLRPEDVSAICNDSSFHVPPMDAPPPSQGTNNAGSP